MVVAQHRPVLALTYEDRPVSPEFQLQLENQDAALPLDLRQRYPVVTRDDIKSRFPDQWIALLPTHVDRHNQLNAGRLIAHAQDWPTFDAEVRAFRKHFPGLPPFTYFTGRYPMGRNVVHV